MNKLVLVMVFVFLVVLFLSFCAHHPEPPLTVRMYCDICERVTNWLVDGDYFVCTVSSTKW